MSSHPSSDQDADRRPTLSRTEQSVSADAAAKTSGSRAVKPRHIFSRPPLPAD